MLLILYGVTEIYDVKKNPYNVYEKEMEVGMQNGKGKKSFNVITLKGTATVFLLTVFVIAFALSTQVFAETNIEVSETANRSYLRVGETRDLNTRVDGRGEIVKLSYSSSKPGVASITKEGVITGKNSGTTYVHVKATVKKKKNGKVVKETARKKLEIKVTRHRHISHRGVQTSARADSKQAYIAAGRAHFWGAEADLRVSKRDSKDEFQIYINHDPDLRRACGVKKYISNLTPGQMKNLPRKVITLNEFLDICEQYDMVPYLDMKEAYGDGAVKRIVEELAKRDLLEETRLVGYHSSSMHAIRKYAKKKYGVYPKALLNCGENIPGGRSAYQQTKLAKTKGFEGVSVNHAVMNKTIDKYCKKHNMEVTLWTYDAGQGGKMASQYKKYGSVFSDMDNRRIE